MLVQQDTTLIHWERGLKFCRFSVLKKNKNKKIIKQFQGCWIGQNLHM